MRLMLLSWGDSMDATLFPIRIPPGLFATLKIPMNVFRLAELIQSLLAQLPPHATHLKPTKRPRIVIGQRIVNPQRPGLDLLEETFGLDRIIRVEVGSQTILAIRCRFPSRY